MWISPQSQNKFGYTKWVSYICPMKVKITVKYHVEIGNEVIECNSLEQAERKLRHVTDMEKYLIKTEMNGDKVVAQYLIS